MGCMTRFFFSVTIQTLRTSCSWWGLRLKLWRGTWLKSFCQVSFIFHNSDSVVSLSADVHPQSSHTGFYRSVRQDTVTLLRSPTKFFAICHTSECDSCAIYDRFFFSSCLLVLSFPTPEKLMCIQVLMPHPVWKPELLCWGSDGGIAFDTAKVFLQTLGRPSPPFLRLSSVCNVR